MTSTEKYVEQWALASSQTELDAISNALVKAIRKILEDLNEGWKPCPGYVHGCFQIKETIRVFQTFSQISLAFSISLWRNLQ